MEEVLPRAKKAKKAKDDENADIQQLVAQLSRLGENISTRLETYKVPSKESSEEFSKIKNQITKVLEESFNEAQKQAIEREKEGEEKEKEFMEIQERALNEKFRKDFLTRIDALTQQLAINLTYGEQADIYKIILNALENRLTISNIERSEEPHQISRISEITTIWFNYALEQLSITLSNVYNVGPEVTKQTISILTAALILYNYQPELVRNQFQAIPYFGQFFTTINSGNKILRIISNTAGSITTLYYLLRNAGINIEPSLISLRDMGQTVIATCSRAASSALTSATFRVTETLDRTANLVCDMSIQTILQIGQSTKGVCNLLTDRISKIISVDYSDLKISIYGDMASQASEITPITRITGLSSNSSGSQQSIRSLFGLPLTSGGSSINQNSMMVPDSIIEERFNAIMSGELTNPIIDGETMKQNVIIDTTAPVVASPIETAAAPIQVAEVEQTFSQSQASSISELTDEDVHWSIWLFGNSSSGGKRIRKSRRNIRLMKSKKVRKGKGKRRGRVTKRRRMYNKTLKRYKSKSRF
jgi:hypothetical protein